MFLIATFQHFIQLNDCKAMEKNWEYHYQMVKGLSNLQNEE